MKKFLSLVTALLLVLSLCTAAFAETAEAETDPYADWVVVPMNDMGMCFLIPGDMVVGEPDTENGEAWISANDQLTLRILITEAYNLTLEQEAAALNWSGESAEMNALADAGLSYEHIFLPNEKCETEAIVIFLGSDGCFYFFIGDETGDNGLQLFGQILGTLSPVE